MKHLKYIFFLFVLMIFGLQFSVYAQIISNNGAYISITSGTVAGMDTINNTSTTTLANDGIINISTINNAGTTQGNGTYNISRIFTNTGTFSCGTSSVNYNGTGAQTIIAVNYYNLTTSNARTTNNITYSNTGTIGIAGTFSPNATFTTGGRIITGTTIDFNGSGAQTIPAFDFENVSFSGGNTKTINGNINVLTALVLGANTTLALSTNYITLKSSATNTARVAAIPTTAAITYGTGKFIVERYIPGRRKYRLITSSVTTSASASLSAGQESLSIWGNWQIQGGSTANTGTLITGGTSANGFDQNTTNASLYTYDEVNRRYIGYSSANSKNTKYTPLKAGVAYYMFVYGDRTNTVYTSSPNYTTISATGTLLTGDQTYNSSSTIPLSNVTGQYTMLGNPFASPVNWASVVKTNLSDTYWGWDPNLSSTGGYITVSSAGGVTLISPFTGSTGLNQYIQPGQGFFVRATATSPVLVIREQDKVSNINLNAFRTTTNNIPLIAVNLLYNNAGTAVVTDGALAAFDPGFSNKAGNEDPVKMINAEESVAFENTHFLLSIDKRQMPNENDTLQLNIAKLTRPLYTLQIFAQLMDGISPKAYLEDSYLKTSQPLSLRDTNMIAFTITSDATSFAADRFRIVFKQSGLRPIEPVKTSDIKIVPNPVKDQQVNIQFNNIPKGSYTLQIFNAAGQQMLRQSFDYDGIVTNKIITLAKNLPPGIYHLQIVGSNDEYTKSFLIQ